ncbi:hypothetical protein QN412_13715 [Pseudomonas sp. RTB3]|jgi:hypothetical protein|uniref:DUF6988 family protein n=1 Tax=unclassified Pseudomonas TaxID=196821 RepID=UPI002B227ADB|nr:MULTISPECIES: hypothetical protein [unclassified Pseudomonas]MEB0007887.1 hypothetical protein [Pseudomonas sp. RTB2]MEB0018001.1 hypothetical protein [Pseudomonas sp. RTB3]MEB0270201.1 hypothetical protein [Pseudomonas sp. 5B4]
MDDLLNRSDELHIEILALLERVEAFPGIRHEVALVACGMALEHALSLRLLIRTQCFTSALSLLRLQYEALTRGVWLLYAATDLQVETLSSALTIEAEHCAKKMPMFSAMLDQVIEKAPIQASRMLLNFKEVNWQAMNSFVHSGIHPLRRHAEGYPAGLVDGAIRNSNGLNIMVLQLGVILSGDPSFEGVVRAMQEKYHALLPGLISPLPQNNKL